MAKDDSDLVWSSDQGDLRREKGSGKAGRRPPKRKASKTVAPPAPAGTTIKVRRETSGRKGKTATTITEIPLSEAEIKALGKRLKQLCGVGGTVRSGTIELQGDHREKVMAHLESQGLKAVLAGG